MYLMHVSKQDAPFGVLGLLYLLKRSQTGSGDLNALQVEDSNSYDFACSRENMSLMWADAECCIILPHARHQMLKAPTT